MDGRRFVAQRARCPALGSAGAMTLSWQASKWAAGQRAGSGPAKAILLVLAEDVRPRAECAGAQGSFLSQFEIAEIAEISTRTVWAQMRALEDAGLIARQRRFDKHGHRLGDLVTLNMKEAAQTAPDASEPLAGDASRIESLLASDDIPYSQLDHSLLAGDARLKTYKNDKTDEEESPLAPDFLESAENEALRVWNETAAALGLPQARGLTPGRRRKLTAALKSHGLPGWTAALEAVAASPFCRGENDRGWKPTIDFLLKPDKLITLLEGGYAGGPRRPGTAKGAPSYLDMAARGYGRG